MGKTCSARTSVGRVRRALPGDSVGTFCLKAEHTDWPAEQISSMCEICIGFRLCSAVQAELACACVTRISVCWEGRGLSRDLNDILCSIVKESGRRAEKILSMFEFCIGICLFSADPAELAKTCSDKTSVSWVTGALSGSPVEAFTLKAERSGWLAEMNLSAFGTCIEFRLCSLV